MKEITKKYTNDEVTIVWKPDSCIHSTICWKQATGLPSVFNPAIRPWVNPLAATTAQIIDQVKKCPSGALSYYMNTETEKIDDIKAECIVETVPDGPLLVYGNITIKEKEGTSIQKNNVTAFCRCGASGNKPYCDGSHKKTDFKG